MAVDNGLEIDFAYSFEVPDHERVNCHQFPGKIGSDVAFSELRIELLRDPAVVFY
jgi:hypothetical protein